MDRLAGAWRDVEDRYGFPFESPDIAARAVLGMALMLALEKTHTTKLDRNRAIALISDGTVKGFFPVIQPTQGHSTQGHWTQGQPPQESADV
jgi:hypothetical protein